jgi:hypothetical protein
MAVCCAHSQAALLPAGQHHFHGQDDSLRKRITKLQHSFTAYTSMSMCGDHRSPCDNVNKVITRLHLQLCHLLLIYYTLTPWLRL